MGLGLGSDLKREWVDTVGVTDVRAHTGGKVVAASKKAKPEPMTIAIDFNAVIRNMLGGGLDSKPPSTVIDIFFAQHVGVYSNVRKVIFAHDVSSRIPEARVIFHQTERYAKTDAEPKPGQVKVDGRIFAEKDRPATAEEIAKTTADSLSVSYKQLFNSSEGKQYTMAIFMELLKKKCISRPGPIYVIKGETVWTSPVEYTDPCPFFNWGEADQLVADTAFYEQQFGPVLIDTIDFDIFLSVLCRDSTNMKLRLGNIWTDGTIDGKKFFSFGKAKKLMERPPVRCAEFVDCTQLMERYSGTEVVSPTVHRMQVAAFFLMCGGCDYNKGLSGFGAPIGDGDMPGMSKLFPKAGEVKFLEVESEPPRSITLKTATLFELVRPVLNDKHMDKDAGLFSLELTRMVWCLAYFTGFNEKDGGPPFSLVHDQLFENGMTVGQAWKSIPAPITITEEPNHS